MIRIIIIISQFLNRTKFERPELLLLKASSYLSIGHSKTLLVNPIINLETLLQNIPKIKNHNDPGHSDSGSDEINLTYDGGGSENTKSVKALTSKLSILYLNLKGTRSPRGFYEVVQPRKTSKCDNFEKICTHNFFVVKRVAF